MPDLGLQFHSLPGEKLKVPITYGDRFLKDEANQEIPHSRGWKIERVPYQLIWSFIYEKAHSLLRQDVSQESYREVISDSVKKEDPFTQTNFVESEDDQAQELIFRIRTSPSISCRELGNRLIELFNNAKEEDSASVGISAASLLNFYNFFQTIGNIKCPILSLTPGYDIYASWRAEPGRVFSVHFLSTGDVRFVVFKPNDRHPERQIRVSGITTTDILNETVSPYGVWDWMAE